MSFAVERVFAILWRWRLDPPHYNVRGFALTKWGAKLAARGAERRAELRRPNR